ncbi:MAG: glycoside hydrolase family 16 protein [Trebonia sp.]
MAFLLAGCTGIASSGEMPAQVTSSAPAPPPVLVPATARHDPPPSYVADLGSGWTLAFDQGFGGNGLDTRVWGTCYPWESASGCTNFGNSDEQEWYTPSQDQVSAGALHLVAQRAPTAGLASDGAAKEYAIRSGMVTTFSSYKFQYGYVQVVAEVPYAAGLWPAFWLAAANERWPPEIDIMEHYGTEPAYSEHLHSVDVPVQGMYETTPDLSAGWHVFGLYWSPSEVIWYVDGHPVMTARTGVPQQPMYFIANLAVYQQVKTNWPAGSADLNIKSVKVWQGKAYTQS